MIEITIIQANQMFTMSGDVNTGALVGFLQSSSDGSVYEKWSATLRKSPFNWRKLDVFDLWVGNALGGKLSQDLVCSSVAELPQIMGWDEGELVHFYLVGRNRKNGYEIKSLKMALESSFVEGVLVFSDGLRAVCFSHDGNVRVFPGRSNWYVKECKL